MADASYVISDDEDIDYAGTNIESAVLNDDSTMQKKKYKNLNELHSHLSHHSEVTIQATGKAMNIILTVKF